MFPACRYCNAAKKNDESRFSAVAGVFNLIDPHDQTHWDDVIRRAEAHVRHSDAFRRAIENVQEGALDPLASLAVPTANRVLRGEPPKATLPEEFYDSILRVGFWLSLSLFNRAAGEICPTTTRIGLRTFNNRELSDPLPELNQLLACMNRETPIPEQSSVQPMFSWAWQFPKPGEGIISAELHGCVLWLAAFNTGSFNEAKIASAEWFSWRDGEWRREKAGS